MEDILNKENTGVNLPANPIKSAVSTNSVIKKPLGKLDNVMHQTPGITPFKSNAVKLEGSIAKLSLRKALNPKENVAHKEAEEIKSTSCYLGAYTLHCEVQVVNLFDYMDFPNEQCLKKCGKSILESWSDNQPNYESLFDQLYCDPRTLENHLENVCLPPLDSDFNDLPYTYDLPNIETAEDEYVFNLFPPMPFLENVDILF
ncbi:uncharacterized protein pim [Drosophila takahashii]|uniref:uncharacterized protein pim n=1 Tax=Drosophila takahashii TaxID=29030 RepID=UPI001CF869C1|nr:uncharacterized protein LOC108062005 [Drosophila takahashii]